MTSLDDFRTSGSVELFLEKITGYWLTETWLTNEIPVTDNPSTAPGSKIEFGVFSDNVCIQAQMQYGCMVAIKNLDWTSRGLKPLNRYLRNFSKIIAKNKPVNSILDRSWDEWDQLLTDWYKDLYPKEFRTKKYFLKAEGGGYKESTELVKPGGISRIKRIYENVLALVTPDDDRDPWEKDIVNLVSLGHFKKRGQPKTLDFSVISLVWLKECNRKFIREKFARDDISPSTASGFLSAAARFGEYLRVHQPVIQQPDQINRKTIRGFVNYLDTLKTQVVSTKQPAGSPLRPRTISGILTAVRVFIRDSGRMGLASFPTQDLFEVDDFPDIPRGEDVAEIPEFVVDQMYENLDKLLEPWRSIMFTGLGVGCRIGDCILMPIKCLDYDENGHPYLLFTSHKTDSSVGPLPIQQNLYEVINNAQQRAFDLAGPSVELLFPADKLGEPYHPQSGKRIIRKWIVECDIKGEDGFHWQFNYHQCRHTVGMAILNNGGDERDVQHMLGHATGATGRVYARLRDETRKNEWVKYKGAVIDSMGRVVGNLDAVDDADAQWLKHNLRSQALPNGYCKKPISEGACEHANACMGCPTFRTCKGFLSDHKKHLARCELLSKEATADGHLRKAQLNERTAAKLRKWIDSLEQSIDEERIDA